MRRFLLGFLIALALAVPATIIAAPPHVVNVTNPMTTDLDGGTHNIGNVTNYTTPQGAALAYNFLTAHALNLSTDDSATVSGPEVSVFGGSGAPTSGEYGNNPPGSLMLRQVSTTQAELWFKTGPLLSDWTCVAGCAP